MIRFKSVGCIADKLEPFIQERDRGQSFLTADNYYGLYYAIARDVRPKGILEIGVRYGYSAVSMMMGCNGTANYLGFDNESYEHGSNSIALSNIYWTTLGNVIIRTVDTQTIDHIQLPDYFKPDIIHVDGAHDVPGMIHDLELVSKVALDSTLILVDDTEHPDHTDLGPACQDWAVVNGFNWWACDSFLGMIVLRRSRDAIQGQAASS